MDNIHKVVTDEEIKALAERNAQRVMEIIKAMGDKYLLHPQNRVTKQPAQSRRFFSDNER